MRHHVFLALASLGVMGSFSSWSTTYAASLTNRDDRTHTIEVRIKSSRRAHELAPGNTLKDFCTDGCVIRLNADAANDWALEGSERVSIEGGLVFYDGEETQNSEPNGSSPPQPVDDQDTPQPR